MKKELIIISDDIKTATIISDNIHFSKDAIKHFAKFDDIAIYKPDKRIQRANLVIIKKGKGKKGIAVIESIRKTNPNSLIVVYSEDKEIKNQCYKSGSNFFFVKQDDIATQTLKLINDIFVRNFEEQKKNHKLMKDQDGLKNAGDIIIETTDDKGNPIRYGPKEIIEELNKDTEFSRKYKESYLNLFQHYLKTKRHIKSARQRKG